MTSVTLADGETELSCVLLALMPASVDVPTRLEALADCASVAAVVAPELTESWLVTSAEVMDASAEATDDEAAADDVGSRVAPKGSVLD